jgi:TolB protein
MGALPALAAEPAHKIAFDRDGAIFTAGLDGKGAKKIAEGDYPQISPDGTRVAFNTNEPSDKLPVRHIAVADLATGKVKVLKQGTGDNSFGPAWSPDGKTLLFSTFANDEWQLGLIQADGTGFRIAKKAEDKGQSCYEPTWAADGKSFFCHDLDSIYRFDLDGKLIKKWAIHDIVANGDMSSGSRLSVSPDGKSLLMDIDMNEDHKRSNWDGPPPALWLLDLSAEKATRISKKEVFAWDPTWISNDEYLFLSQGAKETKPSLYRASIKGGEPKLITKGARTPSVAR